MQKSNILNDAPTLTFPSQVLVNTSGSRIMSEQECKAMLPQKFKWIDCGDPSFREALTEIWFGNTPVVLISGQGGCGKSVLYQLAYWQKPSCTRALASTGIAAENLRNGALIPCTTIHSGLKISSRNFYQQPYRMDAELTDDQVNSLSGVYTILIDEVSMVSANLMDQILWMMDKFFEHKDGHSIRLILFGDPLQLQPVVTEHARETWSKRCPQEWNLAYGNGISFFYSSRFKKLPVRWINLERVMRQGDAQAEYKQVLYKMRIGKATWADISIFNDCIMSDWEFAAKHGNNFICLTGRNDEADAFNSKKIGMLNKPIRMYHAGYGVPKGVKGPTDPKEIEEKYRKDFRDAYPQYFHKYGNRQAADVPLAEGMQVMVTTNIPSRGVANGTIGTIMSITGSTGDKHDLLTSVKISYEGPGKQIMTTDIFPIRLGLSHDWRKMNEDGWEDEYAYMWALPLMPAYAITFHKAQGLTLDKVYINTKTRFVAPGAMYVALSRCKTLEGIGLSGPLPLSKILPPVEGLLFYKDFSPCSDLAIPCLDQAG